MKQVIFLVITLILTGVFVGCSNTVIYTDDDGTTTVEELNVKIVFDVPGQTLSIYNNNWNRTNVQIERLSSGAWLDIFNGYVSGGRSRQLTAYFNSGDQIAITIEVEGEKRYPFFSLP